MNKRELKKMFPSLSMGAIECAINHHQNDYKTERGFLGYLRRENERWAAEESQPDVFYVEIEVEWHKSRTWGYNPSCSMRWQDAEGWHYEERAGSASGCGYDKHSAAVAEALDKVCRGMLIRRMKRGKPAPYGCSNYTIKDGWDKRVCNPHFEGGIGMGCYRSIAEYLGGKLESSGGKTWDVHKFTFKKK